MSNNSKHKLLITIISILVLANIALLAYFLWYKPSQKHTRPEKNRDMISYSLENEVGFDAAQMARYHELKDEHKSKIKPLFEEMQKTKMEFYKYLQQPTDDSVIHHAAMAIGEKQKAIDLQIFRHFTQLRTVCTSQQQPKFDSLIQRVVHKMSVPFRKRSDHKSENKRTN